GGVHPGLVHLLQEIVLGVGGHLPVVRVGRLAAAPDVHLGVDDQHGVTLPGSTWLPRASAAGRGLARIRRRPAARSRAAARRRSRRGTRGPARRRPRTTTRASPPPCAGAARRAGAAWRPPRA